MKLEAIVEACEACESWGVQLLVLPEYSVPWELLSAVAAAARTMALDTAPADGPDDRLGRRVERLFFGGALGVQPPVEGAISGAESVAYQAWHRRAKEIHQRVFVTDTISALP